MSPDPRASALLFMLEIPDRPTIATTAVPRHTSIRTRGILNEIFNCGSLDFRRFTGNSSPRDWCP
jgi:hypothetical protein